MSETDPVTRVARDLTAIIDMTASLDDEAVHKAGAMIDGRGLPGGLATVSAEPAAHLHEWAEFIAYAEMHHYAECHKDNHRKCVVYGAEHVKDEDPEWEPPLQTLLFWTDDLRAQRGDNYGVKPTISTEANYLRHLLNHLWETELRWVDFAKDINAARVRMENVLHAGKRRTLTRVPCDRCKPAAPRKEAHRLVLIHGKADDGSSDFWKCPGCKVRLDGPAYQRALAKRLRSEGAARYVSLRDAIGVLKAQGRSERTVRKWLAPPTEHVADVCTECGARWEPSQWPACPAAIETDDGEDECGGFLRAVFEGDPEAVVDGYCEVKTRRSLVWWPDLWRLHLTTQARRRPSSAA